MDASDSDMALGAQVHKSSHTLATHLLYYTLEEVFCYEVYKQRSDYSS